MDKFVLIDNSNRKVSANFKSSEFFYPDYSLQIQFKLSPFYCRQDIIDLCQFIRNDYKYEVFINSFVRPDISQLYHFYALAIDIQISRNNFHFFHKDFQSRVNNPVDNHLLNSLFNLNCRGIGFGSNHIHLDLRSHNFTHYQFSTPYCIFNE